MPNALLEALSSIVFPILCEICGRSLSPNPPSGVCQGCSAAIRWIAAPHCPGCGRTLVGKDPRCAECRDEHHFFDKAFACAQYEGTMRELLHIYKFQRRKYLGYFFTDMLRQFIHRHLSADHFDAVLPVPSAAERYNERGFNPPGLISQTIARDFAVPHLDHCLIRVHSRTAQALLAKQGRKENVKNAFSLKKPELFQSRCLLLIDDILTTGQTASECSRMLKEAGASSITVLALARGV